MSDQKRGIWFRQTRHLVRQVEVIEVWHNERFVATICPPPPGRENDAVITVISKHLQNLPGKLYIDIGRGPPALFIDFEPFATD